MHTAGTTNVFEHVASHVSRIDRPARAIRGVKVLGFTSANTGRVLGLDPHEYGPAIDRPYRYDPDAVRAAIPLYEGIAVNIDHPEASTDADGRRTILPGRSAASRFGRLINVRVTADGLVADLEYLASHPLAEMILETAERMPEQLALSHHARCEFELHRGQIVARRIVAVHSVDVIGDRPGTTRSLFESRHPPASQETRVTNVTLQELVQSHSGQPWIGRLRPLLESQLVSPDLAVVLPDDPAPAAVEKATLRSILASACDDAALGVEQTLSRIRGVLETWRTPIDPESARLASLEAENRRLRARDEVRGRIEAAGLSASEPLVSAVAALEQRADQDSLLAALSAELRPARPRSSEPLCETGRDVFARPDGRAFAQLART